MKALKNEIINGLCELDGKASEGMLKYSDIERVKYLCETLLKLKEVCDYIGESEVEQSVNSHQTVF